MQLVHLFLGREMERPELIPFLDGTAAIYTAPSPGRTTPNEDASALIARDADSGLIVVADGAGGTRGGGDASRIAVETLARTVLAGAADGSALRVSVLNGIEQANHAIAELGTGAATTVVIAQIKSGELRPYHAGDSVVMLVGARGKVKHQNVAHGPVGYAVEAGMLDQKEAMVHEERHLVSNFVGSEDMMIEVGPRFRRAALDTLLVASDGLSDNLYLEEIVERMRRGPLHEAATKLVSICRHRMSSPDTNQPSKPDDLTIVLFRKNRSSRASRVRNASPPQPAVTPVI
ncbi:MAG: protein phosphatase 2C domain-containing protein [Acidobacteriota bacterium]|nr:protein phosphatase 2C domain-containing protein [Acidobacteriota bacterium]